MAETRAQKLANAAKIQHEIENDNNSKILCDIYLGK